MAPSRRLSQRISEGDGIAIIVRVSGVDAARAAEEQGAKAIAFDEQIAGIRASTTLPLLWLGGGEPIDTDALSIRPDGIEPTEIEYVMAVRDEEEIEAALEEHDPEIFLISPSRDHDDGDPLEAVLELLPEVPAGKLAIAHVDVTTREEVEELERAGFDAVLVDDGHIGGLVGDGAPEV